MSNDSLTSLFATCGPLLFDFDGPICSVFSGYSASRVAAELVETVSKAVGCTLPPDLLQESDPLEVLRWAHAEYGARLTVVVEEALCAAELRAVSTAEPTPFAREAVVTAAAKGMKIAIVSNNSEPAISRYLSTHRLDSYFVKVVGRAIGDPTSMKPSPELLSTAIRHLGIRSECAVLVGDSLTDITAAKLANVRVVGYANKSGKLEMFHRAGADAVVTSMEDVAKALTDS